MNQLASQSRPVSPRGIPSLKLAMGRLNHSMFIRKMPNSAKPRTTSSASMRWLSATGVNGSGLGGVADGSVAGAASKAMAPELVKSRGATGGHPT